MHTRIVVPFGIVMFLLGVFATQFVVAQQPITPTSVQTIETATSVPVQTVVPNLNDARLASCAAHTNPDFFPHIVVPGDTLRDLLNGVDSVTVTQLAALNCLDDPNDLPVGALINIPRTAWVLRVPPIGGSAAVQTYTGVAARIDSFTVTQGGNNLEGVTFAWRGAGLGASLTMCQYVRSVSPCESRYEVPYPPNHEMTVEGFQYPGVYRYRLTMFPDIESFYHERITRDLTVEIVCAYVWIGDVPNLRCPESAPVPVMGAYQEFEGGEMIWFSDTREIYVSYEGLPTVEVFEDTYREGELIETETPPDGLYAPVRGFGKVWAYLQDRTGRLGWAIAPEVGGDILRQPAGRSSYTTYIEMSGVFSYAFTNIPGSYKKLVYNLYEAEDFE